MEKIHSAKKQKDFKDDLILNEAAVAYIPLKTNPKTLSKLYLSISDVDTVLLGSIENKPENQMTSIEKMNLVRIGISKKGLESLKEKAALDYDKLAKALSVTRATLINKKDNEKFNSQLSERIVGLADIYSYGYEVFEDNDHFNKWMFRPNQALGGKVPYDFIDNQFGREEVKNIIGRIDYGVYS